MDLAILLQAGHWAVSPGMNIAGMCQKGSVLKVKQLTCGYLVAMEQE